MLGRRRRRRPNIKTTFAQRLVFGGTLDMSTNDMPKSDPAGSTKARRAGYSTKVDQDPTKLCFRAARGHQI